MGMREEVAAINAQADEIRRIVEELRAEAVEFWRDENAVAEYEEWEIQKLLAEQDAEQIAEQ